MKYSEYLQEFYKSNEERYKDVDIDSRKIATLINMVMKIGEILDEIDNKIGVCNDPEHEYLKKGLPPLE